MRIFYINYYLIICICIFIVSNILHTIILVTKHGRWKGPSSCWQRMLSPYWLSSSTFSWIICICTSSCICISICTTWIYMSTTIRIIFVSFTYVLFAQWLPTIWISIIQSKLSTEYRRQSSEGYPTKVDWSVEERVIKNKKATETHELYRFRPSVWRNTLLLWSVGLY